MLGIGDLGDHASQFGVLPRVQPGHRHELAVVAQPVRQSVHGHRPRLLAPVSSSANQRLAVLAPVQQPRPQRGPFLLLPRLA